VAAHHQSSERRPGENKYRNVNYSILGAFIETVAEQRYADWVRFRVLGDAAEFPSIERRAVPHALAAKYYPDGFATRANPGRAGVLHPDYTNWSADGGFYVTASQFTDWMYAVYAGLRVRGGRPIVSSSGRTLLFGDRPIFSGGNRLAAANAAGTTYFGFEKNGGTGAAGGSTNGNLKIFTPRDGGPVYTAFVLVNGSARAEDFFNPLFDELFARLP
jgi:CubicO group peptidase (beta-lactamase class C family)